MPYLHSAPCAFQHPSQAAHTIPTHRGRTETRQTLDIPDRTTRSSSVASNMSTSSTLRGFYEHEEYERIEKCLVERVETLKRMVVTFPAYNRKLKACEQQLEECREKLAKAQESFARMREDQRTPNMGESDDEDSVAHLDHSDPSPTDSPESAIGSGTIHIAVPDVASHASGTAKDNTVTAISVETPHSDDESLRISTLQAVRTDELPYLGAALLECHSTNDANGIPYMSAQPTIVWLQDKQHWAEIHCNHCGTQSHDGEPIKGMEGMLHHVRTAHPQKVL